MANNKKKHFHYKYETMAYEANTDIKMKTYTFYLFAFVVVSCICAHYVCLDVFKKYKINKQLILSETYLYDKCQDVVLVQHVAELSYKCRLVSRRHVMGPLWYTIYELDISHLILYYTLWYSGLSIYVHMCIVCFIIMCICIIKTEQKQHRKRRQILYIA